jgi:hypothetical protein
MERLRKTTIFQMGLSVSGPRFESATSGIGCKNANYLTGTLLKFIVFYYRLLSPILPEIELTDVSNCMVCLYHGVNGVACPF